MSTEADFFFFSPVYTGLETILPNALLVKEMQDNINRCPSVENIFRHLVDAAVS